MTGRVLHSCCAQMAGTMNNRWRRSLAAGARAAVLALIILVLTSVFGAGFVARWAGMSPRLFTLAVYALAVLGAVAAGFYNFWRAYHDEDPRPPFTP